MAAPKYDAPEVMPSGKSARYIQVDTSADTFGAGIGRAIQGLGATVTQVAGVFDANTEKLRSEAAKTSANQAFVDASLAAGEAEANYFTTLGTDASAGYKPFLENLKTIREEALSTLQDDEAKQLFDQAFQSNMLSGANQGATHAAKQGKQAAIDASSARVELALNDSATKFADEGLFQSNLNVINEQVMQQAALQGWAPDVTAAKIHELNSLAWESRVTSMAASDPLGAKKTFDRVRDEMTVESRLRVQNTVINAAETSATALGNQALMNGTNEDVRPAFREGIITAGRNVQADEFLIPRANHGAGDITNMHPDTSNRLAALIQAAPPGIRENITIFSGARSLARQTALYEKSGGSGMVAKPSPHAPHVRGDAADLGWKGGSFKSMPAEAVAWLHANAPAFGMTFRLSNEPWHIERAAGPRAAPGMKPDSFVSRIMKAEGGGAGVYSPAGAAGIMQVMPGTGREVALSLGIPWDPHRLANDDNYNLLIGTTYLNQQLNKYGGNEVLAAAAYNAGPGAVDQWLQQFGDPRLGEISQEEWIARIPFDETRGYVQKVVSGAGSAPPARAVTANMSRAEFDERVQEGREWAQMNFPGNAVFEERYVTGMQQAYADMVSAQNAQLEANYDGVFEAVITADESGKYMNQAQFNTILQNNPEFAQAFDSLDPTKKNTIQAQLRTNDSVNNAGATAPTNEQLSKFDYYIGLWSTDNEAYRKADIANDPNLNQEQKKELITRKGQQPPEAGSAKPIDLNMSKALRIAEPLLQVAKILKNGTTTQKENYATFVGSLRRIVDEDTQLKGRQLNDVEMEDIVQNLLTTEVMRQPWFTFFGDAWVYHTTETPVYKDLDFYPRGEEFVGSEPAPLFEPSIPDDVRQSIITQYTAVNGSPPTDALISQIYIAWKAKNRGQK